MSRGSGVGGGSRDGNGTVRTATMSTTPNNNNNNNNINNLTIPATNGNASSSFTIANLVQPINPSANSLKFGIDRILAIDTTASTNYSPNHHHHHSDSSVVCPSGIGATPPCSECVSSLLRCCRLNGNNSSGSPITTRTNQSPISSPLINSQNNNNNNNSNNTSFAHHSTPLIGFYTTAAAAAAVAAAAAAAAASVNSHQAHTSGTIVHQPRALRPYSNILVSDGIPLDRSGTNNSSTNKRKRSWSRAVFSNLQRKGLEKRFQLQKYITKPDRRQLAATLGLTDAQVKVWFQNRRMKWRHSKELKNQHNNTTSTPTTTNGTTNSNTLSTNNLTGVGASIHHSVTDKLIKEEESEGRPDSTQQESEIDVVDDI